MKQKANIAHLTERKKTALHYASRSGSVETVKLLLDRKSDVNATDKLRMSPLYLACSSGDIEMVKVILQYKGNISHTNEGGWLPFHAACAFGHLNLVKYLLQSKLVDVNDRTFQEDKVWNTPISAASFNGHTEIVKYLVENKGNIHYNFSDTLYSPLLSAYGNGHLETVKFLVENKSDINSTFRERTVLHISCEKENCTETNFLIDLKANLNSQDNDGVTPLITASLNGHKEIVKLLMQKGANAKLVDKWGKNAIDYATEERNNDIIEILKDVVSCSQPTEHIDTIGSPLHLFPEHFATKLDIHDAAAAILLTKCNGVKYTQYKDTVEAKIAYINESMETPLSNDEIGAIAYYTLESTLYRTLNETLASRIIPNSFKPFLWYLTQALKKCPLYSGTAYRGISTKLNQPKTGVNQYKEGKMIVYVSFTSSSLQKSVSQAFLRQGSSSLLTMTLKYGRNVSKYSMRNKEEEVLLPPNSCFTVKSVTDSPKSCEIVLEEVSPPSRLKELPSDEDYNDEEVRNNVNLLLRDKGLLSKTSMID
uniref:NAD(P)(+)--arginine ADP-ribosyltransferase n=1 Tax=Arcella intermedia TaxID=1963864 RepID=A0A6B2L1G5_9EUKA